MAAETREVYLSRTQVPRARFITVVLAVCGHATGHELRRTCLTRLREAGVALEAVQARAGRASIESTGIYLHLATDCRASQYR